MSRGDKEQPISMGQIGQSLAKGIGVKDSRFQNFWNYVPIPKLMQKGGYFETDKPIKAIFGANRCLHPDQEIYDPVLRVSRPISQITEESHVLAWNGSNLTVASALRPFKKGLAEMYRIEFDSGETLRCSGQHEVLVSPTGASRACGQLRVGDSLFLPASNSGNVLSIEPIGQHEIWDISVPKYGNYLAGGVISHNSTKTTACLFETVMIYTGIIPPSMQGKYVHEEKLKALTMGPNRRSRYVRIVVMDYAEHWPLTIEPMLTNPEFGMLPEAWSTFERESHLFRGPDGSILDIFSSNPAEKVDERKLRGPRIDLTWIDEINKEGVYTESIARPAAHADSPGLVTLSYCPQEGYECWTFQTCFKACYEKKGNITVRKKPEDCHPDIYSIQLSMKDNPSITPEAYESQKRRYRPWEIAFRVDGEYSNRTANPYFFIDHLVAWEDEERYSPGLPVVVKEVEADPENGVFVGLMGAIDEDQAFPGEEYDERHYPVWRVWETAREGEKYVMTADTAEGNPKSDPSDVSIWKATDPERPLQVAQLHMIEIKPGNLAIQACCMAHVYGNCLLVPEINNTAGGIFIDRARNYENLYKRITFDKQTEQETEKIGWMTNRYTKGPMLDDSYKMLMNMAITFGEDGRNWCPFSSRVTLQEFMAYEECIERDKDGVAKTIWRAKKGEHDDTVISSAIGFRIIKHEIDKLSTCKLPKEMLVKQVNEHYLGKEDEKEVRAFSKWKPQKSLNSLRRQHGVRGRNSTERVQGQRS